MEVIVHHASGACNGRYGVAYRTMGRTHGIISELQTSKYRVCHAEEGADAYLDWSASPATVLAYLRALLRREESRKHWPP
jgi:hypothetical protein